MHERYQQWLDRHASPAARARLGAKVVAFAVLATPVATEVDRLSHSQPLCPPAAEVQAAHDTAQVVSPVTFWEVTIASGICAAAGLSAEPASGR